MYLKVIVYFCCISPLIGKSFAQEVQLPKIGIIGAGIGGSSTAYFLRELFGPEATIDVYETEKIGGRLAVQELGGRSYEVGGTIIHPRNKYMNDFIKLFDLEKRFPDSTGNEGIAFYDGKEVVFQTSPSKWMTYAKIFWRYGLGPMKIESFVSNMLDHFDRIYELQKNGKCFNTSQDLLKAMSPEFVEALTTSTYDGFIKKGLSEITISEFINAIIKVNYGQDAAMQLFVGSVSLAGSSGDLFAIKNGNVQVPVESLKHSQAQIIRKGVSGVSLTGTQYALSFDRTDSENNIYDILILASPQPNNRRKKLQFIDFDKEIKFDGNYHHTICTLVLGERNQTSFPSLTDDYDVLAFNDESFFNSISLLSDIQQEKDSGSKVWKVFSNEALTKAELDYLFSDIRDMYEKDWLAYPEYDTLSRKDSFVLHDRLYHVNAIEWTASAMEMSVIGAKNVALLAYNDWKHHQKMKDKKAEEKKKVHFKAEL